MVARAQSVIMGAMMMVGLIESEIESDIEKSLLATHLLVTCSAECIYSCVLMAPTFLQNQKHADHATTFDVSHKIGVVGWYKRILRYGSSTLWLSSKIMA